MTNNNSLSDTPPPSDEAQTSLPDSQMETGRDSQQAVAPGLGPSSQAQYIPAVKAPTPPAQAMAPPPATAPAQNPANANVAIQRLQRRAAVHTPPPIELRRDPAKWEEHEPIDTNRPTKHTHTASQPGTPGWYIIGASRRGKMHAHEAKYREDAWDAGVSLKQSWNIVAVADGGGSYDLSRIGSQVAVDAAVKNLATNLLEPAKPDETLVRVALSKALNVAYDALEAQAQALASELKRSITARDLSTTLLLLIWCPAHAIIGVAQVGDGLIAMQDCEGKLQRLIQGDSGEVAGATVFLNNVKDRNWESRIQVYLNQQPTLLAAMTDGVADDVLESEENFHMIFNALAHFTQESTPAESLCEWLAYEKRGSFDDRTIAVIYPSQSESGL